MNVHFDIELKNWQKDAMDLFDTYVHDIIVVKSPRQRGKSFLITFYCIKFGLQKRNQMIYFLTVSFKQADKVFNEMKQSIEGGPFIKKIDNGSLTISFTNGSKIQFLSAEQNEERLQGFTANLLIFDETAYVPDDIFFTCLPYTNATKGQVICVSTPRFKTGAFYDLFMDGLDDTINDVHSLDVCNYDTSDMISESRLAYYRKTLPRIKYKMFYDGEFVDGDGEVFQEFGKCIGTPTQKDYNDEVTIGIDWGAATGNDSTVMTAITNNNVVLGIKGFNDIGPTETIDQIIEFSKLFKTKKIIVEKNSIGNVYYDMLKKKAKSLNLNYIIEAFNTTNDSKLNQVENLQVLFENKLIIIPNNEELIKQLSNYERTITKNGKQVFNAAKNGHDDYVMSLMLATWAVKKGNKKTQFLK